MNNNYSQLIQRLDRFIRKFYFNQLIRGFLLSTGIILFYFIAINILEHFFYFAPMIRKILFFSFLSVSAFIFLIWVILPALKMLRLGKVINHAQAAQIIGTHFTNVQDKLLNVLQLKSNEVSGASAELIEASIDQKISEIQPVSFRSAINLNANKKYIKYLALPILLLAMLLYAAPDLIPSSTERLVKNNQLFEKDPPFHLKVENEEFEVVQLEDYQVNVSVTGETLPANVNIVLHDFPYQMTANSPNSFSYNLKQLQKDVSFYIESNGIKSNTYDIKVIPKPIIKSFTLKADYPNYLGRTDEVFNNSGDLTVPQGTRLFWDFNSEHTDQIDIKWSDMDSLQSVERKSESLFTYKKRMMRDAQYKVFVSSNRLPFSDSIGYAIRVIADQYPTITATEYKDSTDRHLLFFTGDAKDDYGLIKVEFVYQAKSNESQSAKAGTVVIEQKISKPVQSFTHQWDLRSIDIQPGTELTYYFQTWDNDGVNGNKMAKTQTMNFRMPSIQELEDQVEEKADEIKAELENTIEETKKLQEEIKDVQEKLVQKKELDWQDKKKVQELMQKHKQMQQRVEEMQKDFQENQKNEEEFKEFTENIEEKREQIQKMMDELLSEEMKEMMKQLEEMMEKLDNEEMMEELEDMEMSNEELEKELDRMLELMKQLEMEQKVTETIEKLEELAEQQEDLAEETEQDNSGNLDEEMQKQEEINESFEEIQKDLEDIQEMNEELGNKMDGMEEMQEMGEETSEQQEQSMEEMQQGEPQKAGQKQQKAGEKMQEMANEMQQMMNTMQQEQMEEDMQAIRQLLENLVSMSLEQENVMDKFTSMLLSGAGVNSPAYVPTVQEQYKLKDDFQIVEDSLVAISKRVFEIESFILKELTGIKKNLNDGIDQLEARKINPASVNEQFVMTGLNNLALMLSETLQQMQQQMEASMPGSGMCNKPGGKGKGMPSMKKMQEQLGEQLEKMMGKMPGKSLGKGEGGMSKEFAQTAAKQAAIREALKKFNQDENKGGNGDLGDLEKLMEEMEENERDLVNKKITQEMIQRQNEIMTRLLEAEEAMRERDLDHKRESQVGQNIQREIPPQLEEYLKKREAEIELYKTVSPELLPYYRDLVEKYFKEIGK